MFVPRYLKALKLLQNGSLLLLKLGLFWLLLFWRSLRQVFLFSLHLFETYISGSSLDIVEYPFEFVGRPCYDIICENQDLLRIVPSLWTPDFLIAISRARLNRVHANPSSCLTPLVVSKASDNSFWIFTLHIVLAIVALTILVIFEKIRSLIAW